MTERVFRYLIWISKDFYVFISPFFLLSFSFDWEDISNTQDTVWPHIQTPRSSSKILRCASRNFNSLLGIGVRALSNMGGRWLSYPKNLRDSRMRGCWNRDTNALKLHENKFVHNFHICWNRVAGKFSLEFNFSGFGFFRFRGKKIGDLNFRL